MNKYLTALIPVFLISLNSFSQTNKYVLYDKTESSDISINILQRLDTMRPKYEESNDRQLIDSGIVVFK